MGDDRCWWVPSLVAADIAHSDIGVWIRWLSLNFPGWFILKVYSVPKSIMMLFTSFKYGGRFPQSFGFEREVGQSLLAHLSSYGVSFLRVFPPARFQTAYSIEGILCFNYSVVVNVGRAFCP